MMPAMKKKEYDTRFRAFVHQMIKVSRMCPKEQYLYNVMDSVPFKDLETALLMASINYGEGQNDNRHIKD